MAGNFGADYTGIVCRQEAEHKVIPAFARTIRQMNWARLHLDNVRISERRVAAADWPASRRQAFTRPKSTRSSRVDGIDNALCPYATLPNDWNSYLDALSTNTRQKIRRLLKQVEASSEYRITVATPETFERDLKTLLGFWETKWRARKADRIDSLIRSNGAMLTRSFHSGLVYLPTFWHGDRPVAALATLMEPRKRTFSFYMTGRDETFEGPPAGMILHAYSIRHAIAHGFVEYDFLRGNEPYKYSFGCKERKIHSIVLETKSGRNLGGRIDARCIPDLLQQATELHRKGQSADAEIGYRRILEVEPRHADALHRLGQLLAAKGDFVAAKRLFRTLTTVRPDAAKAWQCLGQVCESLGQHEEALRQHLEFMRLHRISRMVSSRLPGAWPSSGGWRKSMPRCWPRSNRRARRRSGSGAIGGPRRTGRSPANTRSRCRAGLLELPC